MSTSKDTFVKDVPLPGTVPALSANEMETRVAHAAEVATRRALQVTPSDSPVVNLLIHFKAQVDVLQSCGAFDDPSSVVGKELYEMRYETLSATIDAHIEEARKEEPNVDMAAYMASDNLSDMLPYRFDKSMVPGDLSKVEKLVEKAADEVVQQLLDNPPEPGSVQRVIAQESVLRADAIVSAQLDFLESTADASDEVLRKEGADGTDLGLWSFSFNDAHMNNLVDDDKWMRSNKRTLSEPKPMFSPKKRRAASSLYDSDASMETDATPAEDLQRLLEQQGMEGPFTLTPGGGFSGAGMLEEFKDSTIIPAGGILYDAMGASRRYKFSGAHFLLGTVKYQMCMARKKPLSALASIVPRVLSMCLLGWPWQVGSFVAIKVTEAIYNRSRGEKVAAGGVVATTTATTFYLRDQIAEGQKELNLLQACESAPPDLTLGDALGTAVGNVESKSLTDRVMGCAKIARDCTNDRTAMKGKAACDAVKTYIPNAEELTKKTYVIGGEEARKGTRFLFRLRKGATTIAPDVPETVASSEQAEKAAELASRPGMARLLTGLFSAGQAIYSFHRRYRPDRARMYLYLNNPIRAPTTGHNRVALEMEKQTRTLEALRLINHGRTTNMPDVGFDPTVPRREWLDNESRRWRIDSQAWKARYAREWNVENSQIISIAYDVSTRFVQPMLRRREDLRKAFLVGEYMFYWLMELLKVYPRLRYLKYNLDASFDYWRLSNNPNGPRTHEQEQANPQDTTEQLLLNKKVGHDYYAFWKLLSAFSLHVHGSIGTHPNPPSPISLACLVTDMRNCVSRIARWTHPCSTSLSIDPSAMPMVERLFAKYLSPQPQLPDGPDVFRVKKRGNVNAWYRIKRENDVNLDDQCDKEATRVQDVERGMVVRLFTQMARGVLYRMFPPKPPVPDGIPPPEPLQGDDQRLHTWLSALPEWDEKLLDDEQPRLDDVLNQGTKPLPEDCQEVRDRLMAEGRLPDPPAYQLPPLQADGPSPIAQSPVVDEVYARLRALRL